MDYKSINIIHTHTHTHKVEGDFICRNKILKIILMIYYIIL